jgi:FkbH-like protein
MSWLPPARDFRGELRMSVSREEPSDRLEGLARLASCRLGFLEMIQLDDALCRLQLKEAAGFQSVRLALLGSATVDHLLPGIRIAGLRRRLLIETYSTPFGQYRQALIDSDSSLQQFAPQVVLFSLTGRDAMAGVSLSTPLAEVEESVAKTVQELRALWRKARGAFAAAVIQQSFLDVTEPLFGSYDRFVPGAPSRIIQVTNDRVCEAAAQEGVLVLDLTRSSARDGLDAWFDIGRWLHGKIEIAPQAAHAYGEMVVRILAAQRGLSKKCLVLDLDNTLWGGVVGDDGIEGIVLGEGSSAGEAHLALQRYAKQLKDRGIILAVCSKNDPGIAAAAFDHPEMVLRRSDISAFLANWEDKTENLRAVAKQLNIGLDSLVFVDDNPVERARIRDSLPMIAVPELADDPADYVRCLAEAGYFEAIGFTSEDRNRAQHYAANAERATLLESAQSMDDFLRRLDMSVVYGPFTRIDQTRIVQLINKTNQFNTTTRRYTSQQIGELTDLPSALTLQFRLLDRFGDNGLVSTMILRPSRAHDAALEIENWVMSCRVFGRQLELEAMNIAVEAAHRRGAKALVADYVATPKNGVIRDLYPCLGFEAVKEPSAALGSSRWLINLSDYVPRNTHIARHGAAG